MERYVVVLTTPGKMYDGEVVRVNVEVLGHYPTKKDAARAAFEASGLLERCLSSFITDLLTTGSSEVGWRRFWTILDTQDRPGGKGQTSLGFDRVYQEVEAKLSRPKTTAEIMAEVNNDAWGRVIAGLMGPRPHPEEDGF